MRELSPYSSQQSRWRGGAAFWACYRAPTTALQPPLPRRGACARKVPTWRLNCRCPSARRRWRCAFRSPNGGFGDFHPRARLFVPCSSPKLPLRVPSGAGRGTNVCSSCRKCVLRASNGFSANDGGDAVGEAAQKPPPLGRHPALVRQSAAFKTETRKVPRLSAALLGSIRVCNVGRVGTRQKWRGARRCRGV